MNTVQKYKQVVAALLLAVYTFIATPVQLWHHHPVPSKTGSFDTSQEATLAKNKNPACEANCPVCSHKYSVYTDDVIVVDLHCVNDFFAGSSCFIISSYPSLFVSFLTRGPPVALI